MRSGRHVARHRRSHPFHFSLIQIKTPLAVNRRGEFNCKLSLFKGCLEPDFHLTANQPALVRIGIVIRYSPACRSAFQRITPNRIRGEYP